MKLLLVADAYPPEISSAAELMRGLAEALSRRGHDVTVLTTVPLHKIRDTDAATSWPEFSHEKDILVVRAKTLALHHPSYLLRGLAILVAPFQMWRALWRHASGKFDAVFIMSPPVTLGFLGWLMKRRGAGVLFNVQDIFPQNAIDIGILRNPILIAFFRAIERFSYRHADIVTAHSVSNRERLRSAHPAIAEKVVVVHNWIDVERFLTRRGKDYRKEFGVEGKFVALFAGALGPSQGVHLLVSLAERVRDLGNLVFLVVGDGTEKEWAIGLARSRALKNILFHPLISQDDYPDLLAASDAGIVCLISSVRTPVVPGKILGYMVASLPVAAFVNAESDVHHMVAEANCGMSCVSDNLDEMERIIRALCDNPKASREFGRNGKRYAVERFSRDRIVLEIEGMFERIQRRAPR